MIPIILITRNNISQLRACIESIEKNTQYPYILHVVDNCSDNVDHKDYLASLEDRDRINVWYETTNKWILGINNCLMSLDDKSPEYYVVSDSDIIFPEPSNKCWLTELVDCMEKYPFLGKLGLSLSKENLVNRPHLEQILEMEHKYSSSLLAPEVYLSLVDTTAAIYRPDLYVWEKFRIYPRHIWAMKPGYYSGRHKDLVSYHLGWDENEYSEDNTLTSEDIESKVKCFAKYAGRIDATTLNHATNLTKLYYLVVSPLSRLFWGGRLVVFWLLYIIRSKVIWMNHVMAKLR